MNGTVNIILLIVVVLVILFVLSRSKEFGSRMKDTQKRAVETQKFNMEEIRKAQGKRDEQITLLKEIVELEKQNIRNQTEIINLLKQK